MLPEDTNNEIATAAPFSQIKNMVQDEETFSVVYKFLLQHTDSPIWICDKEGKTIFINNHYTELTGFSFEDMRDKSSLDFFESKYHPTIMAERERRRKGLISSYEVKFRTKDRILIPVKMNVYPLPNGGAVGIMTNLSKDRLHENIHQALVENMEQAVWVGDENDICIYTNPAVSTLLGYTQEEMLGKPGLALTAPNDQRKVRKELESRIRGQVSTYEISLVSKSGDHIPVRITANPLPSGGSMAVIADLRNEQTEELAYKHLIENMNEAVWLRSKDGVLEFANKHFCKLVGYDYEELIGDTKFMYWDQSSLETIKSEQKKRGQGLSSVYRGTISSKSGAKIPVLVSASPTRDGGSFGIITDLREILAKESLYQNLVEHMNEAVWMGDPEERTVYANPKFCELTGYRLEDILGQLSYIFWDEQSTDIVKKQNMLRSRGQASNYEGKLKTKDGSFIPVLVSGTPTYDNGTIGIITDLRALKKKEQELSERDHYLATVVENSADGIVSIDLKSIITSWNKGAENIFGFNKSEVIGQNAIKLLLPEHKESGEVDHINKEVARKGHVKDFRTQRVHKNGHIIDVALTKSAIQDDEGNFIGYSMTYHDISIQKKWEEELNLRFDNLKNAYIELGKKGRHMDYFVDLLDGIVGNFEINSIADFIIGATSMITKVDACTLRTYNSDTDELTLIATNGVTAEWYNKGPEPFHGSVNEKAFSSHKPLKILDLHQEPLYKGQKLARKHDLNSLLVIPLYVKDEFLGTLKLYISKESKFELLDNDFIENFAKIASIALKLNKDL